MDEYIENEWNIEYGELNEEKEYCTRNINAKCYNSASISFGERTLIGELDSISLNILSPKNIEHSNFNASATYWTSFKCTDNNSLAFSRNLENSGSKIIVIWSSIISNTSSKISFDNFDLLNISSLCFSNSIRKNSGAINSNLSSKSFRANTLKESPFFHKAESTTFTSTTLNIFYYSDLRYLSDNAVLILSVNSSISSSVNCDFKRHLFNLLILSNLDIRNLLNNKVQSIFGTPLRNSISSDMLIFNSAIDNKANNEIYKTFGGDKMMEKDVCYNKIMLINYEGEKDFTRRIGNIFSSI